MGLSLSATVPKRRIGSRRSQRPRHLEYSPQSQRPRHPAFSPRSQRRHHPQAPSRHRDGPGVTQIPHLPRPPLGPRSHRRPATMADGAEVATDKGRKDIIGSPGPRRHPHCLSHLREMGPSLSTTVQPKRRIGFRRSQRPRHLEYSPQSQRPRHPAFSPRSQRRRHPGCSHRSQPLRLQQPA